MIFMIKKEELFTVHHGIVSSSHLSTKDFSACIKDSGLPGSEWYKKMLRFFYYTKNSVIIVFLF